MTPEAATRLLRTRQFSKSLAECDGWTNWALPELRKMLADKQKAILEDPALRGDALNDARAEHRALAGFLTRLRENATAAFQSIRPGTLPEESAEQVMPDLSVRQIIIDRLSPRAGAVTFSQTPAIPNPESRIPSPVQHNPFAGLPMPAASKPTP